MMQQKEFAGDNTTDLELVINQFSKISQNASCQIQHTIVFMVPLPHPCKVKVLLIWLFQHFSPRQDESIHANHGFI